MNIKIIGPAPEVFGVEPLHELLVTDIQSAQPTGQIKITSAYLQMSGIELLRNALIDFIARGGKVQAIIGIDDKATSGEALMTLLGILGAGNVFVFHNPAGSTFHPKFYLIQQNTTSATAYIGSSNFTLSGFNNNFECNIQINFDLHETEDQAKWTGLTDHFESIRDSACSLELTSDLLKSLRRANVLSSAAEIKKRSKRTNRLNKLFPSLRVKRIARRRNSSGAASATTAAQGPLSASGKRFLMTLAYNDVGKGYEPYLLIPKKARDNNSSFWGWKTQFALGGSGELERRFKAQVLLPNGNTIEDCRLYDVPVRSEFRLVCRPVYELGSAYAGSIVSVSWVSGQNFDALIEVVPQNDSQFKKLRALCKMRASSQKIWGYS